MPAQPDTDRRDRIAAAMREHDGEHIGEPESAADYNCCADAVIAADQTHDAEVRAAALDRAAAEASQIGTEMREGEWSEEMTTREVRDACEHVASSLRRLAAAARPDDTTGA